MSRSYDDGSSEVSYMNSDYMSIGMKYTDAEGNVSSESTVIKDDGSYTETGLESVPYRSWTYNFNKDGHE